MPTTHEMVFALWPSVQEMARDLGESPMALVECKYAGTMPEPRHDEMIIKRAIFLGKKVTREKIARARRLEELDHVRDDRKAVIKSFYERAGGVSAVAEEVGASVNALRMAQSRGTLPKIHKHAMFKIAERIGSPLDEELFEALR
jgi:hypothetical protein